MTRPSPTPDACVHHWIFETPHDGLRYVIGTCRKCGDVKVLLAGFEENTMKKQNPGAAFARGTAFFGGS